MSVNQTSKVGLDEQLAILVASVIAGLVGGAFIQFTADQSLLYFAWLINADGMATAWAVWMATSVLFGIGFAFIMARTVNTFTNLVIMISRKSRVTQKLLVPLLHETALGLTAGAMGGIYSQVLGFGLFAYVFPVVLISNGYVVGFPLADFTVIFAYLIYGHVLGTVYGNLLEAHWYAPSEMFFEEKGSGSPIALSEEQVAGLKGSVVAGLVSGLLILTFVLTGTISFSTDPLLAATGLIDGFAIWMGISLLSGLAFVSYVSRTINDFTNTVIMFSRRSTLTQKILVPLITRAALTVTAGSMGLGFGLILGILFYGTSVVGLIPATTPLVVLVFVVYGQTLGTSYGLIMEDADLSLPFGSDDDTAAEDAASDEDDFVPMHERSGFAGWRARRPFAGSTMLMLSGMIIAAIPIRLQEIFPGPSKAALGIVFGAMIIACGVFVMIKPDLSTLIGVTAIAMSILSLIGAFGGLVIGMLVGVVGGSLCVAYQDPTLDEEEASESRFRWIGEGDSQRW